MGTRGGRRSPGRALRTIKIDEGQRGGGPCAKFYQDGKVQRHHILPHLPVEMFARVAYLYFLAQVPLLP